MKTTKIKSKIKWPGDPLQYGRVPDQKFCLYPGPASFLPGELDRPRSEVHTRHFPPRLGKRDDVGACATSNVYGATRCMVLEEVNEFWWADACIPRRLPKIPVMKKKAAQQVLHVLVKGLPANVISRTEKPDKCHFDNSIEFFYNDPAIKNIPMIGRANS